VSILSDIEIRIAEALRPFRHRFNNMIRRAVIDAVNDKPLQSELQLTVMADEVQDSVEHFQEYGLTSRPPKGSEAILLRVGGSSDIQVAVATALREKRPKLAAVGDVTIWDQDGQMVELKRTKIVITLDGTNTLELGAGATKGVNRVGDTVGGDTAFDLWVSQVQTALNVLSPGAVAPTIASMTGTTGPGSTVVKAVD
jgi:phage baseplate assembly protein V